MGHEGRARYDVNPLRIFISSVQGEFAEERAILRDYVRSDRLIRRFFEVFLFDDAPASDRRRDQLYLDEVEPCDIYVGLFGFDYGNEDEEGVSPTEREFDCATAMGAHRLIFVKGTDDIRRPKMQALVRRAQAGLIRKRFHTTAELVAGLYAALVEYLEGQELDGNPGHDSALRRGRPAGTRVRRLRWLRDHDSPGSHSETGIRANDGGGGSSDR